jgi:hypothetical protein
MRRFGQDTFYHFYQCPSCGKQRAVPREDRALNQMADAEGGEKTDE